MKIKNLYKLFMMATGVVAITACSDSDQPEPYVINYPHVVLDGEQVQYVALGGEVNIGYSAFNPETGADMTYNVDQYIYDVIHDEFVGSIDTDVMGYYQIYYEAYSNEKIGATSDTYSLELTQEIYVYNPDVTTDISGDYILNATESEIYDYSYGEWMTFAEYATEEGASTDGIDITIQQLVPGFFIINDIIGGLYSDLWGYDAAYAASYGDVFRWEAYLSLDTDNQLSLLYAYSVYGWSTPVGGFSGSYDPETGVIEYQCYFSSPSNFQFKIVLEPA